MKRVILFATFLAAPLQAQDLRAKLDSLDDIVARDSANTRALNAIGRLFLDAYNAPEAIKTFDVVLRRKPNDSDALFGKAEALDFVGQPGALDLARRAVGNDPNNTKAHEFLTREYLSLEQYDSARAHMNASPIARATYAETMGDTKALEEIRTQLANNRKELARLDYTLAELSIQQRQYAAASRFAAAAIANDSTLAKAYATLGINQLRLGQTAAAKRTLDHAFERDRYNVWVKNTLDLLDRLATFGTRDAGRFQIVAAPRDVDVLTPYATLLGEEAFDSLAKRYDYKPPTPVRVEFYDRHADFSVRTVGLAGLGALGVSFGSVLALDAPSSRDRGEFNWGSTLWHELSHAFHLGMTNHRVPRWFTEGLAVWEERRARPGWGEEGLPLFLQNQSKLLPLAQLNAGFSRPTYPQQVGVSYYQASLVCEMIETKYGVQAIRGLLKAYADGKSTDAALQSVLHKTTQQVDDEFKAFLQTWSADVAHRRDLARAQTYESLIGDKQLELAMYVSPYDARVHEQLASEYASQNNWPKAIRERRVIVALQPVDMAEARYQLALALNNSGDKPGARKEVLRALEIAPNFEKAQDLLLRLQ